MGYCADKCYLRRVLWMLIYESCQVEHRKRCNDVRDFNMVGAGNRLLAYFKSGVDGRHRTCNHCIKLDRVGSALLVAYVYTHTHIY